VLTLCLATCSRSPEKLAVEGILEGAQDPRCLGMCPPVVPEIGLGEWQVAMTKLRQSAEAFGRDGFERTLKRELEALGPDSLPLQRGTHRGGQVDDSDISVTVIDAAQEGGLVVARIGVFFNEIVGGCSCGDDPLCENAFCEIRVEIDRATAEARFEALAG
jgi:hypothetical protein